MFSFLKYLQLKDFSILLKIRPLSLSIIQNYLIYSYRHHEKQVTKGGKKGETVLPPTSLKD